MEITLNELLPKRIRKIQTGSELLLAYELDKYSKIMLGKTLKVDVSIAKELLSGEHFSFVVQNGLDVGMDITGLKLADNTKFTRVAFTGTVSGIQFSKDTAEEVVYSFNHDQSANAILHYDNRSAGYVSLVAYLIVKAHAEGVAAPKLTIAHSEYNQSELEYVDLFVLQKYGNKIIESLVTVEYATSWGFQPEWEAFVIYNRQRGFMNGEYNVNEKYKHLKKNFAVGDVVLLYKRSKGSQGKTINKLKSCFPAVISYMDNQTVKLTYFPIVQTRFTRNMELSAVEQDIEDDGRDSLFTEEDYARFDRPTVTFNLTEVGVDLCTFVEQDFFIKPLDFDGAYQYFVTPNGSTHVHISTLDVIYAVFEDRKVDYDKERFLAEYFNGRQPIYEYYKEQLIAAGVSTDTI